MSHYDDEYNYQEMLEKSKKYLDYCNDNISVLRDYLENNNVPPVVENAISNEMYEWNKRSSESERKIVVLEKLIGQGKLYGGYPNFH